MKWDHNILLDIKWETIITNLDQGKGIQRMDFNTLQAISRMDSRTLV